ncbi:hypothetical protein SAMN05720354_105103 [Nitrosospira sp. Nsp1]|nr:hypothetical protein SAMN05720354_105103 [Nitrosospira sp. Nsp1]
MSQHQFPEKTLLVGFAPLPSSCLLMTATIIERVSFEFPGFCQTQ